MPRVLFITDEVFLPLFNGSGRVYLDVAQTYRNRGHEVFGLSFYRRTGDTVKAEAKKAYEALFADYRFLPGWNGRPGSLGRLGYGLREADRWLTGNVFPSNPLLFSDPVRRDVAEWVRNIQPDEIYVHKLHAQLLLGDLLDGIKAHRVLDLHDDFIEKEKQYRVVYKDFFRYPGLISPARLEAKQWLRLHMSRINEQRSRRIERDVLLRFDDIRVASSSEYEHYRQSSDYGSRVSYAPWPVVLPSNPTSARASKTYDFGFIGSSDVMNVDAALALLDAVMPVYASKTDAPPSLLIGGRVANVVQKLKGPQPGVVYLPVVDDIQSFYDSVNCVVVPLRYGAGVSIKLLEAIATGVTVVTTPIGARGLPDTKGLLVGPTWEAFADQMIAAKAGFDAVEAS